MFLLMVARMLPVRPALPARVCKGERVKDGRG